MSGTPWTHKVSTQQKAVNKIRRMRKRKRTSPTLSELRDSSGVYTYCTEYGLSKNVTTRILAMVQGRNWKLDWRDYRRVPSCDRVPRSLEDDALRTPPRYWDIDHFPACKEITERETRSYNLDQEDHRLSQRCLKRAHIHSGI